MHIDYIREVRVVEDQWIGGPGSLKAGPLLVASSLHQTIKAA